MVDLLPPLVSIIIPCYNAERWIGECLDSAIAQTHRPLEIIVIDDGSTDGSLEVIKQYAQQHPKLIQYETGPNRGGCAARNRGFVRSKGQYVLFLDADDLLEPETILGQVKTLDGRENAIAACPWWNIEWTGSVWLKRFPQPYHHPDHLLSELYYGDFIPGQALLYPRRIIETIGGWDETLKINQDGDLRWRALLAGYMIVDSSVGGFAWRRYSLHTVSTRISDEKIQSMLKPINRVEEHLRAVNKLDHYKIALARAYHRLGSFLMSYDEMLADQALANAWRLGGLRSINGSAKHCLICYTIGLKRKERLVNRLNRIGLGGVLGRNRRKTSIVEYNL